jgi:hypothetical protein
MYFIPSVSLMYQKMIVVSEMCNNDPQYPIIYSKLLRSFLKIKNHSTKVGDNNKELCGKMKYQNLFSPQIISLEVFFLSWDFVANLQMDS